MEDAALFGLFADPKNQNWKRFKIGLTHKHTLTHTQTRLHV